MLIKLVEKQSGNKVSQFFLHVSPKLASLVSLANQTQPMPAWTAFIGHTGATLKVIHAGVDQVCFARLPCLYASVNYSATFLAV